MGSSDERKRKEGRKRSYDLLKYLRHPPLAIAGWAAQNNLYLAGERRRGVPLITKCRNWQVSE